MRIVEKTLDILEAILNRGGEADLSDLAKMTGLHLSTVRRFTSTLAKRGYLFQKNRGGKYSFGIKFLQFTDIANASINIKEKALPFLKKLCDETSETVTLTMLDRVDAIDIAMVGAEHTLRVVPSLADGLPLHCTAAGKIFLAYMQDNKMNNFINTVRLRAYTNKTITDKAKLKREIESVKREGIAFVDEEYELGIRAAAAPIRGENGNVIASVNLVTATSRTDRLEIRKMVPKVKNCALKISRAMGYQGE